MTRKDAQIAYRGLWASWLLTANDGRREWIEQHMDGLQPLIARGPNTPEWQSFIDTLPGFRDYWKNSAIPRIVAR